MDKITDIYTWNITKNKKLNYWINKIMNAVHKGVSYRYGGWFFFASRMVWNLFLLYFFLIFLKTFLLLIFSSQGAVEVDSGQMEAINTVLFVTTLLYLLFNIPRWRDEE